MPSFVWCTGWDGNYKRELLLQVCKAFVSRRASPARIHKKRKALMSKILMALVTLCLGLSVMASGSYGAPADEEHQDAPDSAARPVNPVVQWNKTLLVIVRTPKAQPPTIHPTRSFAILHAAIYDAVNAIDRTHKPYLVHLARVPRVASEDAAADAAARAILVALYPNFQATLDSQLHQLLAQIPDGAAKSERITPPQTSANPLLPPPTNAEPPN